MKRPYKIMLVIGCTIIVAACAMLFVMGMLGRSTNRSRRSFLTGNVVDIKCPIRDHAATDLRDAIGIPLRGGVDVKNAGFWGARKPTLYLRAVVAKDDCQKWVDQWRPGRVENTGDNVFEWFRGKSGMCYESGEGVWVYVVGSIQGDAVVLVRVLDRKVPPRMYYRGNFK